MVPAKKVRSALRPHAPYMIWHASLVNLSIMGSLRATVPLSSRLCSLVERAGVEAKLGFKVHPHMLRHAWGYALANKGHDTRALQAYLGHRNIRHTVRYTELSPGAVQQVLARLRSQSEIADYFLVRTDTRALLPSSPSQLSLAKVIAQSGKRRPRA